MNKIAFLVVFFVITGPVALAYVAPQSSNDMILFSTDRSTVVESVDEDGSFDTLTSPPCNSEEFKRFHNFLKNMGKDSKEASKNKDNKLDDCSVALYKVSFKEIKKTTKNKQLSMTYCGQAADYCKGDRIFDRVSLAIFEYENLDERCSSFVDLGVSSSECSLIFF